MNEEETVCECDHLTNFAVLMDVHGYMVRENEIDTLSKKNSFSAYNRLFFSGKEPGARSDRISCGSFVRDLPHFQRFHLYVVQVELSM